MTSSHEPTDIIPTTANGEMEDEDTSEEEPEIDLSASPPPEFFCSKSSFTRNNLESHLPPSPDPSQTGVHGCPTQSIFLRNPDPSPPSETEIRESTRRLYDSSSLREWKELAQSLNRRQLRRNIDRNTFRGSGYQDLDDSGNYDPATSKPKETSSSASKRTRLVEDDESDCSLPKRRRSRKYNKGKGNGMSKIVTLPAKSGKIQEYLKAKEQEDLFKSSEPRPSASNDEIENYKTAAKAFDTPHQATENNEKYSGSSSHGIPTSQAKIVPAKPRRRKRKDGEPSSLALLESPSLIDGGVIKYITTSFCHPIDFNYMPPANSSLFPCHFCALPSYGLLGLGERRVEIIEWDKRSGAGNEELSGGWSHLGEENTRMCVVCTMSRLLIVTCEKHVLRRIEGLDSDTFDYEAAFHSIIADAERSGKKNSKKEDSRRENTDSIDKALQYGANSSSSHTDSLHNQGQYKSTKREYSLHRSAECQDTDWCSICISPAFFRCCTTPHYDEFGTPISPESSRGCGLLLCESCAEQMAPSNTVTLSPNNYGVRGSRKSRSCEATVTIDHLLAVASQANYNDGLRADASFLGKEGELFTRLERGMDICPLNDGYELDMDAKSLAGESSPAMENEGKNWLELDNDELWELVARQGGDEKDLRAVKLDLGIDFERKKGTAKEKVVETIDLTED